MPEPTVDTFVQLETQMWNALVAGNREAAALLLSNDYLGVYATGFSGRDEYLAALADGPIVASFEISRSRIMKIPDDVVMFSYRADLVPLRKGVVNYPKTMYISSLWCRRESQRGGRWVNVFSQDTAAEGSVSADTSD